MKLKARKPKYKNINEICSFNSTVGENIQLDVSGTFKSEDDYVYDRSKNLLHIGISFTLLEMNNRLRERGSNYNLLSDGDYLYTLKILKTIYVH